MPQSTDAKVTELDAIEAREVAGGTKVPWGWTVQLIIRPVLHVERPELLGQRFLVSPTDAM